MLNKCQIKKPTSQEAERAGDHSFCSQKYAVTCFGAAPWQLPCVSVLCRLICSLTPRGGEGRRAGGRHAGRQGGREGERKAGNEGEITKLFLLFVLQLISKNVGWRTIHSLIIS